MGLGKFFKSMFGSNNSKKFESPDVTFIEEDTTGVTHTIPISVAPTATQQIIIKNDDECLVFHSKDEIPSELLEEIGGIDDLETVDSYSVIIDGNRQLYTSYEDIPEEVRKAIEEKNAS